MQLANHTFLVSGGASGLGEACVRLLVGAGANVVIADLKAGAGQKLAAELGYKVRFTAADVTDESSVQAAVSLAVETFGALHGSIQCAGIIGVGRVLGQDGPHPLAAFGKFFDEWLQPRCYIRTDLYANGR